MSGTNDSNIFATSNPTNTAQHRGGHSSFRRHQLDASFGRLPRWVANSMPPAYAYADNDAFFWGYTIGSSQNETASLYRVTNGTPTLIMTVGALGIPTTRPSAGSRCSRPPAYP